jgi:hypothetical protein
MPFFVERCYYYPRHGVQRHHMHAVAVSPVTAVLPPNRIRSEILVVLYAQSRVGFKKSGQLRIISCLKLAN